MTPATGAPVRSSKKAKSRREQGGVASKFVYDVPLYQGPLFRVQEDHGADQLREYATPVYVSHQQDGCIGMKGHPHIDDVVLLEVDFRGASGTLDHYHVVVGPQSIQR